jgi:chromosome segregation ATPase
LIEHVMIFTLGALVAALMALLALPAVRRRAERLATRRVALTMPLSMDEVIAERDQIRAGAAAEQRRVELRAEAIADLRAADMAELGRRAATIVDIEASLASTRAEAEALRAALATATREREEAWGERAGLGKALHDSDGRADREASLRRDLEARHAALGQIADERRATIAGLQTRLMASEAESDARGEALHAARETRRALEEQIAAAREADARTRADHELLRRAIADLGDRLMALDAPTPVAAANDSAVKVDAAQ